MNTEELKEKIAEIQHSQWSGWMEYLFSKGSMNMDGSFTIDKEYYERWKRQQSTPYSALSDREQESDRIEADKLLSLLSQYEKERDDELVRELEGTKIKHISQEEAEKIVEDNEENIFVSEVVQEDWNRVSPFNAGIDEAISLIRKEKE